MLVKPWKLISSLESQRIWIRPFDGQQSIGKGKNKFICTGNLGIVFEIDNLIRTEDTPINAKFWWVTSGNLPSSLYQTGYTQDEIEAQKSLDNVFKNLGIKF